MFHGCLVSPRSSTPLHKVRAEANKRQKKIFKGNKKSKLYHLLNSMSISRQPIMLFNMYSYAKHKNRLALNAIQFNTMQTHDWERKMNPTQVLLYTLIFEQPTCSPRRRRHKTLPYIGRNVSPAPWNRWYLEADFPLAHRTNIHVVNNYEVPDAI